MPYSQQTERAGFYRRLTFLPQFALKKRKLKEKLLEIAVKT
jgi:hypothetical protein